MKASTACFIGAGILTAVSITLQIVKARNAPAGDFACTVDGVDSLFIADVDGARVIESGAWRVDVEAGFYLYAPRAGELCAVMP